MKNIKNTKREERDARLERFKKQRKKVLREYVKFKRQLLKLDMEILQIEQANEGHFFEYEE